MCPKDSMNQHACQVGYCTWSFCVCMCVSVCVCVCFHFFTQDVAATDMEEPGCDATDMGCEDMKSEVNSLWSIMFFIM